MNNDRLSQSVDLNNEESKHDNEKAEDIEMMSQNSYKLSDDKPDPISAPPDISTVKEDTTHIQGNKDNSSSK